MLDLIDIIGVPASKGKLKLWWFPSSQWPPYKGKPSIEDRVVQKLYMEQWKWFPSPLC